MNIKKILILLLFLVAIVGIIAPINAVDSANSNKIKIKWDANGGKIGNKKTVTTTINKGSKIGSLQKATRTGYTLKGWYTKKTGGTKITKNTKLTKSVNYYAQWTKGNSKTLNAYEKQLVGSYTTVQKFTGTYSMDGDDEVPITSTFKYTFNADGTYKRVESSISPDSRHCHNATENGRWSANKNALILTNRILNANYGTGNIDRNKKLEFMELTYFTKTQNGKKGIVLFGSQFYERIN